MLIPTDIIFHKLSERDDIADFGCGHDDTNEFIKVDAIEYRGCKFFWGWEKGNLKIEMLDWANSFYILYKKVKFGTVFENE